MYQPAVFREHRRPGPWSVIDAPSAFIASQIGAIIGVEIPISHIEGKWKVSQNRSAADRQGVQEGLRNEGVSEEMARLVAECDPAGKQDKGRG